MENLCSQGYTQQGNYLAVKNPDLLRAGIWEEDSLEEVSLFTSVYAADEEGGSEKFSSPKTKSFVSQKPPKTLKPRVPLRYCFFLYL